MLRLFVETNGWRWDPYPSVDEAERAVVSVATGVWDDERTAVQFVVALGSGIRTSNTFTARALAGVDAYLSKRNE